MTSPNQIIALLPMKAHSERVSRKNFRDFAGKPLFRWILDSLLSVDLIDQVVINTDAREILGEFGINDETERVLIRDRPAAICGDMVSMNLVIEDDVRNVPACTYLMTHTTNPLLSPNTISSAINHYQQSAQGENHDSLFTVNKIQTRFYREDGSAVNHDPDNLIRTQDLEPWFEENSNLYIFSGKSFEKTNARIGEKPVMFETPNLESYDIDDQDDWNLAELIAQNILSKNS